MKNKFFNIRINVTEYDVTFALPQGGSILLPRSYATGLSCRFTSKKEQNIFIEYPFYFISTNLI